jgi:hypothetical protein
MRRPLVILAAAASLAGLAVPVVTNAGDVDQPASGPSTTEGKPIDTAVTPSVDPSEFDPDGLVDAARAGYAEFISNYSVGESFEQELAGCPWIASAELVTAVAPIGDAVHLEPEIRPTLQTESNEDDDGGTTYSLFVTCDTEDYEESEQASGPVYGVGIGVFDYSGVPDFMVQLVDFVESVEGGVVVEPSADTLGGTLYGYCEEDDDLPPGANSCFQFWVNESFVVGMYVITDSADPTTLAQLEAIVFDQLRPLLQRLADGIAPVDVVASDDDDVATDVTVTVTATS